MGLYFKNDANIYFINLKVLAYSVEDSRAPQVRTPDMSTLSLGSCHFYRLL